MNSIARFSKCLIVAASIMVITPGVSGQILNLPSTLTRPELISPTWCDTVIETIQDEMALIQQEMLATGRDRIGILQGRYTYRRLIENLLVRGQRAGWSAAPAIVAAIKLTDGRHFVDAALQGLTPRGSEENDVDRERRLDAIESVMLFVSRGRSLADSMPVREPILLDRRLSDVFQPLAQGLSLLTGEEARSCWPSVGDVESSMTSVNAVSPIDEAAALTLLSADDPARGVLAETLEILRKGLELAPLRHQSIELNNELKRGLDAGAAILSNEIVSPPAQEAYRTALSKAVVAFRNQGQRSEATARLAKLHDAAWTCGLIESIPIPRADRRALVAVWVAMDRPGSVVPSGSAQRSLQDVLQRMKTYRTQPPIRSLRDVRAMNNRLGEFYEDAERRLLGEVGRLANEPDLVLDPSFASLLAEQIRLFEAIERVRAFPQWIDLMERIEPGAARSFQGQLRKINSWLLTSSRQDDAMRVLKSLAEQVAIIESLPDDAAISSPSAVMDALMDGRGDEVAATIRSIKTAWVKSWARGDAGSQAAIDLGSVSQVMTTIAEVVVLMESGGGGKRLQRWSPWCLAPEIVALAQDDLLQRLRLATTALVDGDHDAAQRQLDRVHADLPMGRLTASLMSRIGSVMNGLPVGSVGAVSQVAFTQSSESWGGSMRGTLAEVAWMSREARHARSTGRVEEARATDAFVNDLANGLIMELIGRPLRTPRLHGFDGSDPQPTPDDMSPMQ
jgi:hypothetical protein